VLQKDWRARAVRERDQRQRSERRKQRSARLLGAEAVDPSDCLPYTVYPIEPEVLVSRVLCLRLLLLILPCLATMLLLTRTRSRSSTAT
jgi:hypothetical protein